MTFSNLSAVVAYLNAYVNTNGTNSITGASLNTALNGIAQFVPNIGLYSLVYASGTTGVTTIPLSYQPMISIVQSQKYGIEVTASIPSSSGITVNYNNTTSVSGSTNLSYIYL